MSSEYLRVHSPSAEVQGHGGSIIKTIGDEVMCTFPDAALASCAAGDMHSAVRKLFSEGDFPVEEMHISVGMHYGPVLVEEDPEHGANQNPIQTGFVGTDRIGPR